MVNVIIIATYQWISIILTNLWSKIILSRTCAPVTDHKANSPLPRRLCENDTTIEYVYRSTRMTNKRTKHHLNYYDNIRQCQWAFAQQDNEYPTLSLQWSALKRYMQTGGVSEWGWGNRLYGQLFHISQQYLYSWSVSNRQQPTLMTSAVTVCKNRLIHAFHPMHL